MSIVLINLHRTLRGNNYPHLPNKKAEAQRGGVTGQDRMTDKGRKARLWARHAGPPSPQLFPEDSGHSASEGG